MALAERASMNVELISYGHTVIQAANLHAALAFGRTSFFEQAVPPEAFEHGVLEPIRTGPDGSARVSARPGLGIDMDPAAIEDATLEIVRADDR
jgi:L-alanine-DL-glutamate epimerase-like enolase superfamily enzyme